METAIRQGSASRNAVRRWRAFLGCRGWSRRSRNRGCRRHQAFRCPYSDDYLANFTQETGVLIVIKHADHAAIPCEQLECLKVIKLK